jgi:hypothetical protein
MLSRFGTAGGATGNCPAAIIEGAGAGVSVRVVVVAVEIVAFGDVSWAETARAPKARASIVVADSADFIPQPNRAKAHGS